MQVEAKFAAVIPYVEGLATTDKITHEWKGKQRTYNIAGPPYDTNDELIVALNEDKEGGL